MRLQKVGGGLVDYKKREDESPFWFLKLRQSLKDTIAHPYDL